MTQGTGLGALRTVADYQFGRGAGRALFPPDEDLEVRRSTGGRPRQVHADEGRLVSYGTDGRFTLGVAGGRRLAAALDPPAYRVAVGDESEPFVREGANAFAFVPATRCSSSTSPVRCSPWGRPNSPPRR